jgi:hypothetical protein
MQAVQQVRFPLSRKDRAGDAGLACHRTAPADTVLTERQITAEGSPRDV